MYSVILAEVTGVDAVDTTGRHYKIAGNDHHYAGEAAWTDGRIIYGHHLTSEITPVIARHNGGILWLGENILYAVYINFDSMAYNVAPLVKFSDLGYKVDWICTSDNRVYACISGRIYDMMTGAYVYSLDNDYYLNENCYKFSFDNEGNFYEALTVFNVPNRAIIKKNGHRIIEIDCDKQSQFYSTVYVNYGKIYYRKLNLTGPTYNSTTGYEANTKNFVFDLGNHIMHVEYVSSRQDIFYFDDLAYKGDRYHLLEKAERVEFIKDVNTEKGLYLFNSQVSGIEKNNIECLKIIDDNSSGEGYDGIIVAKTPVDLGNLNSRNYGVGLNEHISTVKNNFIKLGSNK